MLKYTTITLASAATALALSAVPVNADPYPFVLSLYESTDMADREVHIKQAKITTTCTPLPEPLTEVGALSGENFTTKAVGLYTTLANCNADVRQAQLNAADPGNPVVNANFNATIFFYKRIDFV